jgi:hypothetical protein
MESPSMAVSNMIQSQPVVMGLLAEPNNQPQGETILCLEAVESDEIRVDLKKRKRAMADSQETAPVIIGVIGARQVITVIPMEVVVRPHGISCVLYRTNHLYHGAFSVTFNDIMDANEKRGRTARSPWLINGFRRAVLDLAYQIFRLTDTRTLGSSI